MRKFFWDELLKRSFGILFVAILGLLGYLLTPLGEKFAAIWNSPEALGRIESSLARNTENIAHLSRGLDLVSAPQDVVEWSPASRMGPCKRGQECILVARFRRAEGAEVCHIIPGSGNFSMTSYNDFVPRGMRVIDAQSKNIGSDFETMEIRLRIPMAVPIGLGEVRVTTSYIDCPWQIDGQPPVTSVSPPIRVEITG